MAQPSTKRARDYGLRFGVLPTGSLNVITDVPGVQQESQQVNMLFGDYDCCTYTIIPNGNGYDWQHPGQTFIV
ncbi:unnamed protein product [Rotaria sp. Silwood1]|nr:unnamed protein product [Rotaria sp. Silwood1]